MFGLLSVTTSFPAVVVTHHINRNSSKAASLNAKLGSRSRKLRVMVKISPESISEDALYGIIDDYVLREGTDYGGTETPLARKREQVLLQLQNGTAEIWFDPATESATILLKGEGGR